MDAHPQLAGPRVQDVCRQQPESSFHSAAGDRSKKVRGTAGAGVFDRACSADLAFSVQALCPCSHILMPVLSCPWTRRGLIKCAASRCSALATKAGYGGQRTAGVRSDRTSAPAGSPGVGAQGQAGGASSRRYRLVLCTSRVLLAMCAHVLYCSGALCGSERAS